MSEQNPDLGYEWWIKVRNADQLEAVAPMEASFSYPVIAPGMLRFFHYRVEGKKLFRPFSIVDAVVPGPRIVQIRTVDQGELFPGLPQNLGDARAPFDAKLRQQMLNLVPELVRRYRRTAAGALGTQYDEALRYLAEPALMPFYEALNPEFFSWLVAK